MTPWSYFAGIVVTFLTWIAPMEGHREGFFYNYGGQQVLEANAHYRGYTYDDLPPLGPAGEPCLVAAMSPSMLGQLVWLRPHPRAGWVPCRVVDVVSRVDWYGSVMERQEIAEIPRWLIERWDRRGNATAVWGEMYLGQCPPPYWSEAQTWRPPWEEDHLRPVTLYSAWPYPVQADYVDCRLR